MLHQDTLYQELLFILKSKDTDYAKLSFAIFLFVASWLNLLSLHLITAVPPKGINGIWSGLYIF